MPRPISTPRSRLPSTTRSATTSCVSCSSPAIRCCPPRRAVALTLRLLGGLTTDEIARAFLVPEPHHCAAHRARQANACRSPRALRSAARATNFAARLSSVLEVIYLVFNEGYSATAGDDWMRPALCDDALRLGRMLAGLAPHEPEVHGLVALMEIQASRMRARVGPDGEPILCSTRIARAGTNCSFAAVSLHSSSAEALAVLAGRARAIRAAGRDRCLPCASAHRRRIPTGQRIAALYDALAQLAPSPVVELNRAVALAMAFGPAAGLEVVDTLTQRAGAQGLPPAAQRARRSAAQARTRRRGARRIRARGEADAKCAGAGVAPEAGCGVRREVKVSLTLTLSRERERESNMPMARTHVNRP